MPPLANLSSYTRWTNLWNSLARLRDGLVGIRSPNCEYHRARLGVEQVEGRIVPASASLVDPTTVATANESSDPTPIAAADPISSNTSPSGDQHADDVISVGGVGLEGDGSLTHTPTDSTTGAEADQIADGNTSNPDTPDIDIQKSPVTTSPQPDLSDLPDRIEPIPQDYGPNLPQADPPQKWSAGSSEQIDLLIEVRQYSDAMYYLQSPGKHQLPFRLELDENGKPKKLEFPNIDIKPSDSDQALSNLQNWLNNSDAVIESLDQLNDD